MKTTELSVSYVENIPELERMQEGVLYISHRYETTSHLCPCGCGIEVPLPFSLEETNKPKVWRLIDGGNREVTLVPSIQITGHCGSHYNIQASKIVV